MLKSLQDEVERLSELNHLPSPEKIKQNLLASRGMQLPKSQPSSKGKSFSSSQLGSPRSRKNTNSKLSKNDKELQRKLHKFSPQQQREQVIAPGYTLRRDENGLPSVTLTDEFWEREHFDQARKEEEALAADRRDETIAFLQGQLQRMAVFYEDQKISQRHSTKKTEDDFAYTLQEMQEQHEEHIRAIEEDQAEEIRQLKDSHEEWVDELKFQREKDTGRFRSEMDSLKESFEEHKIQMQEDIDKKWKRKELELTLQKDRERKEAVDEQRQQLETQRNNDLDRLLKENATKISRLMEDHRIEMDKLMRKFAASSNDADKLKQADHDIKVLKEENETLKDNLSHTGGNVTKYEKELGELRLKLFGYETRFEEKIAEVDEMYSGKINMLIAETTDLRKKYMMKCEELRLLKKDRSEKEEKSQQKTISGARDLMEGVIRSRNKTDISLISQMEEAPADERIHQTDDGDQQVAFERGLAVLPAISRGSSAPSTRDELQSAGSSRTSDDTSAHQRRSSRKSLADRPPSSVHKLPGIEPSADDDDDGYQGEQAERRQSMWDNSIGMLP